MIELKHIQLAFDNVLIQDGELIIPDEKITVIAGESGSGKSSLLYDIALITKQAQMDYQFYDYDIATLSTMEKQDLQRNHIAFVFQNISLFHCFLHSPHFVVWHKYFLKDNPLLPMFSFPPLL